VNWHEICLKKSSNLASLVHLSTCLVDRTDKCINWWSVEGV